MRLSILVPLFNEEEFVGTLLERVIAAIAHGLEREIIVADDGSRDSSSAITLNGLSHQGFKM
jgi:glycosyltransferase involved in cell wall biosynthesis